MRRVDCVFTCWRGGLSDVILGESACGRGYMSCSSSQQNVSLEHFMAFQWIAHESSGMNRSISVHYGILHISRLISERRSIPASNCFGVWFGKTAMTCPKPTRVSSLTFSNPMRLSTSPSTTSLWNPHSHPAFGRTV